MFFEKITLSCLLVFSIAIAVVGKTRKFPDGFLFGVATAAFQIEGGWNASDKGPNIWDTFGHLNPSPILDKSDGDVACDSYHLYKRDAEMVSELGVDFYRISLSWSRILPKGFSNVISVDGVRYYNDLINELLSRNISVSVTLYHWDLPQALQDLGGWTNPLMAKYFSEYARVAFGLFGDRVKTWLTFNEPQVFCLQGYGRVTKAPGIGMSGVGEYLCGHTILRAHAKAYHLYKKTFKNKQKGRVGLTLNCSWQQPASNSTKDKEATDRKLQFELGWMAHPIFSKKGDYPEVVKSRILKKSKEQGLLESRLPAFTPKQIEEIRGSFDFFGLNHYTTLIVTGDANGFEEDVAIPSYEDDMDAISYFKPEWPKSASSWLRVVPWGFKDLLIWIKENYDNPEVIIFENGFSDRDGLNDIDRKNYYHQYLNYLLDAIEEGCNVTAYTAWSLMDNFEWNKGYSERFGLYYVDYNSPEKTRIAKISAQYFKQVVQSRSIESI